MTQRNLYIRMYKFLCVIVVLKMVNTRRNTLESLYAQITCNVSHIVCVFVGIYNN
jgi:Na+/H+ antiporter NhaC